MAVWFTGLHLPGGAQVLSGAEFMQTDPPVDEAEQATVNAEARTEAALPFVPVQTVRQTSFRASDEVRDERRWRRGHPVKPAIEGLVVPASLAAVGSRREEFLRQGCSGGTRLAPMKEWAASDDSIQGRLLAPVAMGLLPFRLREELPGSFLPAIPVGVPEEVDTKLLACRATSRSACRSSVPLHRVP